MFVKPEVRKSLLARMLAELLETRVLVKKSMKANKDQAVSECCSTFVVWFCSLYLIFDGIEHTPYAGRKTTDIKVDC
jgi:DNA polymerase zeta